MTDLKRREFLATTASGLGLSSVLHGLGPLSADEVDVSAHLTTLGSELESLVQFLELTPRESIIQETAARIQAGLSYRQLLAALLLAGVRNIQPRPSVGFKFHAVLVVNSAHLASISSADGDRWLPILWAVDNFKSSQARDEQEGDWTLPAVDERIVPPAHQAAASLRQSLERWDVEAADVAITSLVRHFGANHVFEQLARYAARDFRSIGHKVIYLSNAFRTLQTIGWEYAEPVMRSLVYAMLNHSGEPNPAESDLEADRPGRTNRELLAKLPVQWRGTQVDDGATSDLVRTLHECSAMEGSEKVVDLIRRGLSVQSIWDGLFASAAELLMRQRGIVALHAVTTTNAIRHAFNAASDDSTRQYLLLQNASFLPMFRQAAMRRGKLADRHIDALKANEDSKTQSSIPAIFATMASDRPKAAEQMFQLLSSGADPQAVVDHARRLVFLKGNDAHDYKFSSAVLEDYRGLSPIWRERYLAASVYQLRHSGEPTRSLVDRIRTAMG